MRAVAVALTIGRPSVQGFLACLSAQTKPIPTVLWVDDVPDIEVGYLPRCVHVVRGDRLGSPRSIGLVRRAACDYAMTWLHADTLVLLDDDDYYAPNHVEVTCAALEHAQWTSGVCFGLSRPGSAPERWEDLEGIGPQGTWAMRVETYLAGGGYQDDFLEEVALANRIGWREKLTPHRRLTHVRLLRDHHLSLTVSYDRAALRQRFEPATLTAVHRRELDELADWCRQEDLRPPIAAE